jgi:hypothetical protein
MFNSQKPSENDLPTSAQLLKSTIVAFIVAGVLLLFVILPAEYGIDPTGVGNILGLTKMGEIKTTLKEEAFIEPKTLNDKPVKSNNAIAKTIEKNQDIMEVKISPGEAIEIKLEMKKGLVAHYKWTTQNGGLNFDLHGDGYEGTQNFISYKKGRMTHSDSGGLKAEFDGFHGWFWRNRNEVSVTVKLEATGDFIQMKLMK